MKTRPRGRQFRWKRTHNALIAACVSALREGRVPSAVDILTRADVAGRTLFNHFETLAELHSAGLAVILADIKNEQENCQNGPRETADVVPIDSGR